MFLAWMLNLVSISEGSPKLDGPDSRTSFFDRGHTKTVFFGGYFQTDLANAFNPFYNLGHCYAMHPRYNHGDSSPVRLGVLYSTAILWITISLIVTSYAAVYSSVSIEVSLPDSNM
jgi:hypothetical protein